MFLLPGIAAAQEADDYGSWTSIQIEKSWKTAGGAAGPSVGLRGELRTKDRFGGTDIWFIRPMVGYRFNEWLKCDVAYDYCNSPAPGRVSVSESESGAGVWSLKHKFLFSATGSLKSGPLSVSLREMYVRILDTDKGEWSNLLRSRLSAQYSIPGYGFRPYLTIEMFTWTKWINTRHFVGCVIPVGGHCSADLFYMYLTTAGTSQARHIAGLGINVNL